MHFDSFKSFSSLEGTQWGFHHSQPAVISRCESLTWNCFACKAKSSSHRFYVFLLLTEIWTSPHAFSCGRVREHPRSKDMGQAGAKGRTEGFSLVAWGQRMEDGPNGSVLELELPPSCTC